MDTFGTPKQRPRPPTMFPEHPRSRESPRRGTASGVVARAFERRGVQPFLRSGSGAPGHSGVWAVYGAPERPNARTSQRLNARTSARALEPQRRGLFHISEFRGLLSDFVVSVSESEMYPSELGAYVSEFKLYCSRGWGLFLVSAGVQGCGKFCGVMWVGHVWVGCGGVVASVGAFIDLKSGVRGVRRRPPAAA